MSMPPKHAPDASAWQLPRGGIDRPAGDAALGKRISWFLLAFLLSAGAGVALVHFDPLLIVGFVLGSLAVLTILARPFWGLLFYTCLFLIRPAELYPALAPLHLERVVGIVSLGAMFLAQHRRDGKILIDGSRQSMLLLLFVLAVILSIPFSYWRTAAVDGFVEVTKIVIFYFLVVQLIDTRARLKAFVILLSLLILYIGGSAFVSYQQGTTFYAQGIDRAIGQTSAAGDPNQLGTTVAAAIPLFVLLALQRPLGWMRALFAGGTVLLVATLAITGSRASLLGFLGGLGFLWWISKRRLLVGFMAVLLLAAGFMLLPDQYQTRYSSITEDELDASSQGRIDAWKKGVQMVLDRPLFGVGITNFGTAHAIAYSPESRPSYLQAHSLYVQVAAELGLIGAAIFFAFMFEFLRLNRSLAGKLAATAGRWRFEHAILQALFAGFIVLLITGVFGHSLLRRTWYIYAAIGASILRLYADHGGIERRLGPADPATPRAE